jgi:hypothetical protein
MLRCSPRNVHDAPERSARLDASRALWYGIGMKLLALVLCAAAFVPSCKSPAGGPQAEGPLMTSAGRDLDVKHVLPEYPRPELVREKWASLNGTWEFAEARAGEIAPFGVSLPERIVVPFAPESLLSGLGRHVERAWYRRLIDVPGSWSSRRCILHFGAVDWECTVFVNGQQLATHRGGYEAFEVDITNALNPTGKQEILVGVFDPTDSGDQARGKQVSKPEGIYYTPTSGIWQSVWIEPVDKVHVKSLEIAADLHKRTVTVFPHVDTGEVDLQAKVVVLAGGIGIIQAQARPNQPITLEIPGAHAWSPEDPFLYDVQVTLSRHGDKLDEVSGYFGMRSIEVVKDEHGVPRIQLNGAKIFEIGVLDQGFFPDGLYTAPSDDALKADIELAKQLGFNTIRKHVKVESQRWYRWCDELGMLVWQDMPSANNATAEGRREFERELSTMIGALKGHPSIVTWVVFNEGWGQYDTERLTATVKHLDPTRLVSNASGWTDAKVGDIVDMHAYPGPDAPPSDPKRASVLGEFGGLGLAVPGHTWREKTWGYQGVADSKELTDRYVELMRDVWMLEHERGLCAAIYTQITDVETECNGLATYDRAIVKVDAARVAAANHGQVPKLVTLVRSARDDANEASAPGAAAKTSTTTWRYRFDDPADAAWTSPDFDDAAWAEGAGGFGTPETPGSLVGTLWNTNDIWMRRVFTLDAPASGDVRFLIHHDEDADVYIDGVLAAQLPGYTTRYSLSAIRPEAREQLVPGRHVLAIHGHQTTGGQFMDAGLVRVD